VIDVHHPAPAIDERLAHVARVDPPHRGDRGVAVDDDLATERTEQRVDRGRLGEPHAVGDDPQQLVDRRRRPA